MTHCDKCFTCLFRKWVNHNKEKEREYRKKRRRNKQPKKTGVKPLLFGLDSKKSPTPTNRKVSDTDLNGHSNEDSISVSIFQTLETDDEPPSDMETVSTHSSLGKAYKSCGIGKPSPNSYMCNSTDGFINEMKGLQRRETSRSLQNDPLYTKWQEFKLLSKRLQKIQYRA